MSDIQVNKYTLGQFVDDFIKEYPDKATILLADQLNGTDKLDILLKKIDTATYTKILDLLKEYDSVQEIL
jgi:hypothetical protein